MKTLIIEAIRWVNLPYTVLLSALLLYWLTVVLGVLDIDIMDFDIDMEGIAGSIVGAVPVSIWLSIFVFQMWLYSIVLNGILDSFDVLSGSDVLRFIGIAVVFMPIATLITKLVTTPLNKLFEIQTITKSEFVGKECFVTSSQVNESFGTGEVRISGSLQVLDIRAKSEEAIVKNEKALIYKYDGDNDVFYVTRP